MNNIQEIFDEYLRTKPSTEKIRSATSMMIHLGKALNVSSQEEITSDYYTEILPALDEFFIKTPQKSVLDKAILAEMIGRIGPRPKINAILKSLLTDKNENVRQYALQSLEYSGITKPKSVLPFIEQQMKSGLDDMVSTAEHVTAKILCSDHSKIILDRMHIWCKNGEVSFIKGVLNRLFYLFEHGGCSDKIDRLKIMKWVREHCPQITEDDLIESGAD